MHSVAASFCAVWTAICPKLGAKMPTCALNTGVQFLSAFPGFVAALLHSPLEPGPLTRAVATAVNASLAAGPGFVGNVAESVEVLKAQSTTCCLVQEGQN